MDRLNKQMKEGLFTVDGLPATNSPGVLEHGKESKIKKEMNMQYIQNEYEILKPISGQSILEANPCDNDYHNFLKIYGWNVELQIVDLIQMKENHPNWFAWLVAHGYVGVVEERSKRPSVVRPGDLFLNGSLVMEMNTFGRHSGPNLIIPGEGY